MGRLTPHLSSLSLMLEIFLRAEPKRRFNGAVLLAPEPPSLPLLWIMSVLIEMVESAVFLPVLIVIDVLGCLIVLSPSIPDSRTLYNPPLIAFACRCDVEV